MRVLQRYGGNLYSTDLIGMAVLLLAPVVYALFGSIGRNGQLPALETEAGNEP